MKLTHKLWRKFWPRKKQFDKEVSDLKALAQKLKSMGMDVAAAKVHERIVKDKFWARQFVKDPRKVDPRERIKEK